MGITKGDGVVGWNLPAAEEGDKSVKKVQKGRTTGEIKLPRKSKKNHLERRGNRENKKKTKINAGQRHIRRHHNEEPSEDNQKKQYRAEEGQKKKKTDYRGMKDGQQVKANDLKKVKKKRFEI